MPEIIFNSFPQLVHKLHYGSEGYKLVPPLVYRFLTKDVSKVSYVLLVTLPGSGKILNGKSKPVCIVQF